jgi:amino acid adenylation domain-containing protein
MRQPETSASEFPVTPDQLRYILAETLTQANYMQPASWVIDGPLDVARFEAAIGKVVARHEMLRVSLVRKRGQGYLNRVHESPRIEIEQLALPEWDPVAVRKAIEACAYRPHNFLESELARFQLIRIGTQRHVFTTLFHHALTDALSGGIFRRELSMFYEGREPDTTPVAYRDFFAGNREPPADRRQAEAFWQDYLADFDGEGSLPADFRPEQPSSEMDFLEFRLDASLSARAREAARQLGVSPFALYSTVYSVLLGRHTGASSVISLIQSAGRRGYAGSEQTCGLFSKALVLITRWSEEMPFAELARATRKNIGLCLQNEAVPYQEVVSDSGIKARFGINWLPGRQDFDLQGCQVTRQYFVFAQSDHDLNFRIVDDAQGVLLYLAFNRSQFLRSRVEEFAHQFVALLGDACTDPQCAIAALGVTQRSRRVPPAVLPPVRESAAELVHELFLRQARLHPQATAIECAEQRWSYRELERASDTIMAGLHDRGIAPGATLAVLARRTPGLVAALLAVLRMGCAFAILDSAYPPRRLRQCVDMLRPGGIIVCEEQEVPDELVCAAQESECFLLHLDQDGLRAASAGVPAGAATADDVAYHLFTSGTTGVPKCVSVSHRPLVHFLHWQAERFELDRNDRVTVLSGLGHDPVLRDIFLPLSIGATLLLPDPAADRDAKALFDWMAASRPTLCHLTPQIGHLILGGMRKQQTLPTLRYLFWGGDILTGHHVAQFAAAATAARSVNFFGATETPQAFAYFAIEQDLPWRLVPIGQAIPGVELYIENGFGERAAYGEYGQIVARSPYLSKGYLDTGEMIQTRERKASGFSGDAYYFGDYGYTLPDGNIVCLGRRDDQLKVRGFRVELAEISRALEDLEPVARAVALGVGEAHEEARLVAYIERAPGHMPERAELVRHLRATLPRYMVPDYYVVLDELPMLPNGKVDRKQLRAPQKSDLVAERRYIAPKTQLERELIADLEEVLQLNGIGAEDSFVALGGDSLSYVSMQMSLERRLGALPQDWGELSVRELAGRGVSTSKVRMLDTCIAIRAAAILIIVAGHADFFSVARGSTGALFLVTGFLLAKLQLPQVLQRDSARPLLSLVGKIVLPVMAYTAATSCVGALPHYSNFLMVANLFAMPARGIEPHIWFVHALLQMLLIYALLFSFAAVRSWLEKDAFRFCVLVFVVATAVRLGSPLFFAWLQDPASITQGHPVHRLPTTHFATLALGMCMYFSNTTPRKVLTLGLLLGYWLLSEHFLGAPVTIMLLFGGILVFFREIPTVDWIKRVAYMLAAASLFIYLTQFIWVKALHMVGIDLGSHGLETLLSVAGGVAAWFGWNQLRRLGNIWRKQRDEPLGIEAV